MKILSYQDNQGRIYDLVVAADEKDPAKCHCCSFFRGNDRKACFESPDCGLEREVWVERIKKRHDFKLLTWADSDANVYDLTPVKDRFGVDCNECAFANKPEHCVYSPECGPGYCWKKREVTNVQDQS
jgi:hypothetical protein